MAEIDPRSPLWTLYGALLGEDSSNCDMRSIPTTGHIATPSPHAPVNKRPGSHHAGDTNLPRHDRVDRNRHQAERITACVNMLGIVLSRTPGTGPRSSHLGLVVSRAGGSPRPY